MVNVDEYIFWFGFMTKSKKRDEGEWGAKIK